MAKKENIPINFLGGVAGDQHAYVKTRLERLWNAYIQKEGSITKRYGTKKIATASTVAFGDRDSAAPLACNGMIPYGNSSVWIGKHKLYTRGKNPNGTTSDGSRIFVDNVSEAVAELDGVSGTIGVSYIHPDVALANGYLVYVYLMITSTNLYGDMYCTVMDTSKNQVVAGGQVTSGSTFTAPKILTIGTKVYLVYGTNAGSSPTSIYCRTLDLNSWTVSNGAPTWSGATTLASDVQHNATTGPVFDIATDGTSLYLFYMKNTGTNRHCVAKFSSGLTLTTSANLSETATNAITSYAIAYASSGDRIWVGYSHTGAAALTRFACLTSDLTTETVAPQTVYSGTASQHESYQLTLCPVSSTQCAILANVSTDAAGGPYVWARLLKTSASYFDTDRFVTTGFFRLGSKAWLQDGKVYSLIIEQDATQVIPQGSAFVVEWNMSTVYTSQTQCRPVATVVARTINYYSGADQETATLSHAINYATDKWLVATYNLMSQGGTGSGSIAAARILYHEPVFGTEINGILALSGGVPSTFDGRVVSEVGFLTVPVAPTVVAIGSGGSMSAGRYQYILTRLYTDAKGNLHRSAPSPPSSSTAVVANDSCNVTYRELGLTLRQDFFNNTTAVINMLYRTKASEPDVFYQRRMVDSVMNSPSQVSTTTVTDTTADSTIDDYPQLYTTGNVLDNVAPPSAKFITFHRDRVWLAGTPDDSIWPSKSIVEGEGPAFNEAFVVPAFEGGRVTGVASMEEMLFIFKRRRIYIIQGDPADNLGNNATIIEPRIISHDIGCVDARSIVVGPPGVFFQSDRGIFMIARGSAEVIFVGQDVADLVSGYTVKAATMIPSANQVRFSIHTGVAGTEYDVVFDYLHKVWSRFTYYCSTAAGFRAPVAACLANGIYNWVTSGSQEYEENTSSYLDAGTDFIVMSIETGWLRLGDLQNYQKLSRFQMLCELHEETEYNIFEWKDYSSTLVNSNTLNTTTAGITASPAQIEYGIKGQRCQALKLRLTEVAPVSFTTGRGVTIVGLNLLAYMLRGKWRPAPSRRF